MAKLYAFLYFLSSGKSRASYWLVGRAEGALLRRQGPGDFPNVRRVQPPQLWKRKGGLHLHPERPAAQGAFRRLRRPIFRLSVLPQPKARGQRPSLGARGLIQPQGHGQGGREINGFTGHGLHSRLECPPPRGAWALGRRSSRRCRASLAFPGCRGEQRAPGQERRSHSYGP